MRIFKQSTATNLMVFMTDSADHITGKAGLTLTITASKDGAAFASISPTVTDRGNGWYNIALTTAHTDTLGDLALHITSAGADPSDLVCRVMAEIAYLDAAVSSRLATAGYTAPDNASITGIKNKTDNLPTDPADESLLEAAIATRASQASVDTVDGIVDAIKLKTDNIPATPAAVGSQMTLQDNAITAAKIATDAITNAKIAAGAITSSEAPDLAKLDNLASSALVIEVQDALIVVNDEVSAIKGKTDNLPADPADESLLEAAIATRMAAASYTAPDNAGIAAIKAKTDNLPSGIRRNTALPAFSFAMISSSTHVSFATGLTVNAFRSIDGGAFAACSNAVAETGNGVYKIDLAPEDLNGDVIVLRFAATGADDRLITLITEP